MELISRYLHRLKIGRKEKSEVSPCYICQDVGEKQTKLKCKHRAHVDCLEEQVGRINTKGDLISAKCGQCGLCGTWIKSNKLSRASDKAIEELQRFYSLWGSDHQRIYRCFICTKLFYEKRARCADDEDSLSSPQAIRCQSCKNTCETHGDQYLSYKCRYCCKIATYHCGNGNHMCDVCHEDQIIIPCVGSTDGCNGNHLPNGQGSQCLGCTMCMSTLQRSGLSSLNLNAHPVPMDYQNPI